MPFAFDPLDAFVPCEAAPVDFAASGPLGGLPFTVKDIFDVAAHPTGFGSDVALADLAVGIGG